jgi:AcrR family transcriptional regulator
LLRTIDSLLHAAEEIFSQHAVEEITVEEIAARAGAATSSIYGLRAAVVERALVTDRHFMDLAFTAERSPVEQVYAVPWPGQGTDRRRILQVRVSPAAVLPAGRRSAGSRARLHGRKLLCTIRAHIRCISTRILHGFSGTADPA